MPDLPNPIYVTRPALPDLEDYITLLRQIWESRQLTNIGAMHKELETRMADFLGVKYVSLFCNGTLALITALRALEITGEVITTPFSFVATTHALYWNGITPVFVDIEPGFCNMDPAKIESAITSKTTAILPVHTYGNPSGVQRIHEIATKHGLKVIYDAAHAFGVNMNNRSIVIHGDLSVLSFHATKAYSTIEGGAIVCHDEETKKHIDYLRNFGFANEVTVVGPGINAKMNELQAAYGLLQLDMFQDEVEHRKSVNALYQEMLSSVKGVICFKDQNNVDQNYSYFPVFIDEDYPLSRDEPYFKLREKNIFGRRYFYPLISEFPPYHELPSADKSNLMVADRKSKQVICLPIYSGLDSNIIKEITDIITEDF